MSYPADPRLGAIRKRLEDIKVVVAFMSSKGGVGKTLVSTLTSLLLSRRGVRVGLLDLDVTNPTVHTLLGVDPEKVRPLEEMGVVPPEVFGVRLMSPAFFTMGKPAPLRGESISSAIREMLSITRWTGVNALIIDTPPGMGDELLEVLTYIRRFRAIVVTTPSILALESATRVVDVLGHRVEAIVLNMFSGGVAQLSRLAALKSLAPVYTLPYDSEIEEAVGYPERLVSTRLSREVDEQIVNHIAKLTST
ncbi:MAG: P-loop NTPase [Sulfolobales archaeon]